MQNFGKMLAKNFFEKSSVKDNMEDFSEVFCIR